MTNSNSKQESKTDRKIKQGFLRVLAHKHFDDMTIVEVVKEAHISRSTFYLRFENLANVYDALVADMLSDATPIDMQVDCTECRSIAANRSANRSANSYAVHQNMLHLSKRIAFYLLLYGSWIPSEMAAWSARGSSEDSPINKHMFFTCSR